MLRSKRVHFAVLNRLLSKEMSTSSTLPAPHITTTYRVPANEKSLIPEHLRCSESLLQRFKKHLDSDTAPMTPITIVLVGMHVYILWYLFGGEFENDFKDEEKVPIFSDFVAGGKRIHQTIKKFLLNPFNYSSNHENTLEASVEKKDSIS